MGEDVGLSSQRAGFESLWGYQESSLWLANLSRMAKASIVNTTSTGVGDPAYFSPPAEWIIMQVGPTVPGTTATGTVAVEGTVNGQDWVTVFSSTFANERMVSAAASTGNDGGPFSALRATLAAHATGSAVNVHIDGR